MLLGCTGTSTTCRVATTDFLHRWQRSSLSFVAIDKRRGDLFVSLLRLLVRYENEKGRSTQIVPHIKIKLIKRERMKKSEHEASFFFFKEQINHHTPLPCLWLLSTFKWLSV